MRRWVIELLQLPAVLLLVASFGASIYAAANNIANVTYPVALIFGIIVGLYAWGWIARNKLGNGRSRLNVPPKDHVFENVN